VQYPIKGSSAEAAGVLPDDTIVEFNGIRLFSRAQLQDLVQVFPDQEVPMKVERDGDEIELFVTPAFDEELGRAMIGVRFNDFAVDPTQLVHPPPMQQIRQHASLIFRTLRALVTPREAKIAASQIGGPPMIFIYLWYMVKTGLVMALWFTCLLNVNLAIINLMPLPVLDGGHIVFALIEMGLRRPLNEKLVGRITAVFAVLLISAMLFLSVRDVDRFRGAASAPAPAEETAPGVDPVAPETESR
jgi:regulator of sigma E protease